jgi:hypothetical protein
MDHTEGPRYWQCLFLEGKFGQMDVWGLIAELLGSFG